MAPPALGNLPVFKNFLQWFAGDKQQIDNFLFRLHHQYTTAMLMFGLMFIFMENYLDGRAIMCRDADPYAKAYCWIHGTGYVKQHLQGSATGCFVDQSSMKGEEWNSRVTAYYLWLPFLLTFAIGFSKLPRVIWKSFLEGGLMQNILQDGAKPNEIAKNFKDFQPRFHMYSIHFAGIEALNLLMVLLNMFMCDMLLVNKFWTYGIEVLDFLKDYEPYGAPSHNPMCELFPTEVACYITIGARTGGKDISNYLCILSNNLFNQKYFLIVWLWWVFLIVASVLGLVYRAARIMIPELSRSLLRWKVRGECWTFEDRTNLSGADYFMLDRIMDSLSHRDFKLVLEEVFVICHPKGNYSPVPVKESRKELDRVEYRNRDGASEGSAADNL